MKHIECVIVQNFWQAHYKILLFNALYSIYPNFKVLYLAEIAKIREWKISKESLRFPCDVIFEGPIDDINPIKMGIETYKKLSAYNPEVVIVGGYSYFAYWCVFLWAKKNKKKLIVMNESHHLDRSRYAIKENVKKLFVSNCNAALVDGLRHKEYTISLGLESEKIFIKNGMAPIDASLYQKEVSRFRSDKVALCDKIGVPYKNFLFVGRFSHEKNIISLLNAYKRLNVKGLSKWGLILVGNGPQKKEIERYIKKYRLNNVFLPGFKQPEEVPFYYAISDVFVLPSISEPWGYVVNEAMASGLPVLVSKQCGCYPDIVHDNANGFSFNPFDQDELFQLLRAIVQGKYDLEALGRHSMEIIKQYSPERTAEVYFKAISSVLEE